MLSVKDLTVEFSTRSGVVKALDRVSFDLEQGDATALVGESGSGKSVTAKAIMGLLPSKSARITSGSIEFKGKQLLSSNARGRASRGLREVRGTQISMIFQDPLTSLNPVLRVGYQLGELWRTRRGLGRAEARENSIRLMEEVGIPDAASRIDDYPHQFSGGMRQRVVIAMALALRPDVVIADEPTTALDVTVQAQILDLLKSLQAEHGMSLLLISHDLAAVADVASKLLVMYAGRIVEGGTLRDIYVQPRHPYTAGLMSSLPSASAGSKRLIAIPGAPPDALRLPKGCAFHPRCSIAQDLCIQRRPALKDASELGATNPTRVSACHYTEEVSLLGVHSE